MVDVDLGALSKRGHRPRSAACVREGTQLLAARVARRRGRPGLALFSFLRTDVDDAGRFAIHGRRKPDELLLEIRRAWFLSTLLKLSTRFATSLRTQRNPKLTP